MINDEKGFRRTVCRILDSAGAHYSMVESPETSPGIPDLNWCLNGREGWSELKYSGNGHLPHMRPLQIQWIRRRVAAGGNVSVITYHRPMNMVLVLPGRDIESIKSMVHLVELSGHITVEELGKLFLNNSLMEH